MLPKEFDALIRTARENGVRIIALSEPWWWRYPMPGNKLSPSSVNMKFITWGHDYVGYLSKHGYKTVELQREKTTSDPTNERLSILAES